MKKYLLFGLFGLLANIVQAQSIQIIDPVTSANGSAEDIVYIKMHIKNNSANSMDVFTRRNIISLVPGQLSYFCFGVTCYPPNVSVSPDMITLAPGQEDTSIKTYVDGRGTMGSSTVNYCVFNAAKTDSACLTMVYNLGVAAGIINNSHKGFVKVFPNPSSSELKLAYNNVNNTPTSTLQIADMNGRIVYSEEVIAKEGLISVNVSELPAGVYVCNLIADGVSVARDRVIIQ